ncbi:MAG: 50S ribosome-binding GTPase [Gemmataceae bacterium]|nr:50S ribosome-binding GTPase [Gemmataceae bacterium]MDW8243647.1 GTPase [Thermogemmata sp.]
MAFEKVELPHPEDTIVALSSARGVGIRGIVRVSGPLAHPIVNRIFQSTVECHPTGPNRWRVVFGVLQLRDLSMPLPAWLYRFYAPRSYTGQDMVEIHTLGSPPLLDLLIADLLAAGARPARAGEFTLRAFLAGKKDLTQAEALCGVIEAEQVNDLQQALQQLAGGLSTPLQALRDDLLNLLADLEANLDFVDEDITFLTPDEAHQRVQQCYQQVHALLRQWHSRQLSGRWPRIVLVGRPNAGKTSLFNALSGAQGLVSNVPGTTRDYLVQRCELEGITVELIDTAGWQPAVSSIDEQAQRLGRQIAAQADIVLWCDEQGHFLPPDHPNAPEAWTQAVVLRVWTKADLQDLPAHPHKHHSGRLADTLCSVISPAGLKPLRQLLRQRLLELHTSPLTPSHSRCRHHLEQTCQHLEAAIAHLEGREPLEFAAAAVRAALHHLGELTGAVYTNELLDRIFSRFCIGK